MTASAAKPTMRPARIDSNGKPGSPGNTRPVEAEDVLVVLVVVVSVLVATEVLTAVVVTTLVVVWYCCCGDGYGLLDGYEFDGYELGLM